MLIIRSKCISEACILFLSPEHELCSDFSPLSKCHIKFLELASILDFYNLILFSSCSVGWHTGTQGLFHRGFNDLNPV